MGNLPEMSLMLLFHGLLGKRNEYSRQAISYIIGILCFIVVAFVGSTTGVVSCLVKLRIKVLPGVPTFVLGL